LRTYVLVFRDVRDVRKLLRVLRRRNARFVFAVFVVQVEHHNAVKDFLTQQKNGVGFGQFIILTPSQRLSS